LSFGGGLEQDTQERDDLTTSASPRGFWKTGRLSKFTTVHRMDYSGHEMFLRRAFGVCVSDLWTADDEYRHIFTLANAKIMATVERCLDSALVTPKTSSLVCPAAIITAVEFEFNQFDPVKVTYEWLGRDEDALAVATTPVTFPTDHLVVPCVGAVGGTFKVGSTAYSITKGKVRIEDPHAEGNFFIGLTRTAGKPARSEKRKVTGEITTIFDDTDAPVLHALWRGQTESALHFDYQDIVNVSHNYQFLLDVWRTVPTGKEPEVGGPGPVELTIPFKGLYDVANAREAVTGQLVNKTIGTTGSPIL
jgi:hypothetical protein